MQTRLLSVLMSGVYEPRSMVVKISREEEQGLFQDTCEDFILLQSNKKIKKTQRSYKSPFVSFSDEALLSKSVSKRKIYPDDVAT